MAIERLLANNARWAEHMVADDPEYFRRLAGHQQPHYLWIGCSDSRVPTNPVVELAPGDLFVHRNIANLVLPTDLNLLSVVQYAVEVLGVGDLIVCGHYGCGGVRAAMSGDALGLIDHWLQPIRHVYEAHRDSLDALADEEERVNRLCALNVAAQTRNLAATRPVQAAWARGQALTIHGLIYDLAEGRLYDLGCTLDGPGALDPAPVDPAPLDPAPLDPAPLDPATGMRPR